MNASRKSMIQHFFMVGFSSKRLCMS